MDEYDSVHALAMSIAKHELKEYLIEDVKLGRPGLFLGLSLMSSIKYLCFAIDIARACSQSYLSMYF
jgi:hypothetical protein